MAATDPERRRLSARVAAIERHNGSGDPRIAELRAQLAEQGLAEHIRQLVNAAPPLTPAQRARLALLLAPDSSDGS